MPLIMKWPDFWLAWDNYIRIPERHRYPSDPLYYLKNFLFDDKEARMLSRQLQLAIEKEAKKYESRTLLSRMQKILET